MNRKNSVSQRRICLVFSYILLMTPTVCMAAVAGSFPVDLNGTTPENASLILNVNKPADAVNGMLTLSAYDADAPREGELVINGNSSIRLFNSLGVPENDKHLVDITISTPASYWHDGDNKLVFYHVRSGGYSIKEVTVSFDGSSTPADGPSTPDPDPEPIATFSADSIDFGSQDVGGISAPLMLTLTNSGTAPLNISSISSSSGFTETNNCSDSVPAGGNCILDVQFVPTTNGYVKGGLNIGSNATSSPDSVILTGNGVLYREPDSTIPPDALPQVDPNAKEIQFYHDFNSEKFHTYTDTDIATTWRAGYGSGLRPNAVKVVPDPDPSGTHGKVMQVFYAANQTGFRGGSGSQWRTKINGSHDELYFSYDVFFAEDAEFVLGGKLPGLIGGPVVYTGGSRPDGTDGWTGRLAWRSDGRMTTYMYHAGSTSNNYATNYYWRDSIKGQVYLQRGKWNRVEVRYLMNTPGRTDGRHQAWINGDMVLDRKDVLYRMPGGENVGIDRLYFSSFYGGKGDQFAPSTDQYIYFDNFVVSTQPITH